MVKAGTFLHSDRIQKENLKIINFKNPGIIVWINGLERKRWFLLWTELILVLSALLKQYFPSDSTEKVIKTNTSV